MTFDEWMLKARNSNADIGKRIGKSGEAVRRYRTGEREPDADVMTRIFELSNGEVTPNDWVGVGPRTEAEISGQENA